MKALSIRQPWAWLIVNGYKDVENRTWHTRYRGPVLIHASKAFDKEGYLHVSMQHPHIQMPHFTAFETGGIVGRATITDCVHQLASPWFTGPWGFVMRDAEPLPFSPCAGKLGFFDVQEPTQEKMPL